VNTVEDAVAALRAGGPVVLPFDTVYGLAADPARAEAVHRLYELKGRDDMRPSALVAASLEALLEVVPELYDQAKTLARLLPGPVTLVLPNPARRFTAIAGENPDAIGVRVPELRGMAAEVLAEVGLVVATSANRPGEADPRRLEDVPEEMRERSAAVVDGGELPGTPSTVVDLTGVEPRILREGAVSSEDVLRRLGAPVRST
jgi:L-threonylcarbamoyladenylate synthase